MDFKILSTVFTSVFIAELGDKTQLATMLFASDKETSKLTVFVGAALACRDLGHRRCCRRRHFSIRQRKNTELPGGYWLYRDRSLDAGQSIERIIMSKYLMNKLIHLVNMDEEAEEEYTANPREFVEKWEKTQKLKLEPEEREALATKDYGKLYALGAHPFTLWSFTEAVWVHEKPREELVADYKAKAAKAGYPNFKT